MDFIYLFDAFHYIFKLCVVETNVLSEGMIGMIGML